MGSLGNTWENKILDHILKTAVCVQPVNIYIALSTADPTEDASGLAEPSNGNYARRSCATWDAAASRALDNTQETLFNQATANWGTITHFAIFSTPTEVGVAYMIGYGEFTTPKNIQNGDQARIAAGECDISVTSTPSTGGFSTVLADNVLDHIFMVSYYSVPTSLYIAVSTANPTDDYSGEAEPTLGGPGAYARVNHDSWDVASGGASENTGAVTFTEATASWGTITHAMLMDNSTGTGANFLMYAPLDTERAIGDGDTPRFSDGELDITLT